MKNKTPRRPPSQVLGDIGEQTVQMLFTKFKWTADIIKSDYGEDIDCNIFIDNARTNYHFRCQVKSSQKDSSYVKLLKNENYSVSINSNILRAWLTSFFPVFLVIYEEETDSCYWCNPIEQILANPSKLEKEKPSIQILKSNRLDLSSKKIILEEVQKFYRKILRLDEAWIECNVIPVLMPNYRVIPRFSYSFSNNDNLELKIDTSSNDVELLPSWMSVLRKITPSNNLPSLRLISTNTDLEVFLNNLKSSLNLFNYPLKADEWLSFIISPIKIHSNSTSWSNELTYWMAYNKIGKVINNDLKYNFQVPDGFLRQVSRGARSFGSFHFINPEKDIALELFSTHEVTPTIKNIDKILEQNIKGQFILWICKKKELNKLAKIITNYALFILIIDDSNKDETLLAITTPFFNPYTDLYGLSMDWESFENGNVRNKLNKNNLWKIIPGYEFKGKAPDYFNEAINKHTNKKYKNVLITQIEYISGCPLILDERIIRVSRFQMVPLNKVSKIKAELAKIKPLSLKDFNIEFRLVDDLWNPPIFELALYWTPEISKSSSETFELMETRILELINKILPRNEDESFQLKNTYDILHIAGEIEFEK